MTPTEARFVFIGDQNDAWLREQIHKATMERWAKWINATKDPAAFNRADKSTQRFVLICASHFICDVTTQGMDAAE